MPRRIYLEKKPWREALRLFLTSIRDAAPLAEETVLVEDSLGRVTAREVVARITSPHYDSAAMDGIAVKAGNTVGAAVSSPRRLMIGREAAFVDTGDPIEAGFDAVIMIEEVNQVEDGVVEIYSSVPPYRNVRRAGEDFRAGTPILPENHLIRPVDTGGMLAGGVSQISVRRRPKVEIIPTGSELVEPGVEPEAGRIIEFNSRIIWGMVAGWGGEPRRVRPAANDLATVEEALRTAAGRSDVVVTIAGSSAGERDLIPEAVEELGQVLVHGVDLMPGKPVILGKAANRPFIGLPGYPVSAWVAADAFLKPLIARMLGLKVHRRPTVTAVLTQDMVSKLGMEEIVRVTLEQDESGYLVTPLPRGAGLISSLIRADGILRVPPDLEGINQGGEVEVELLEG